MQDFYHQQYWQPVSGICLDLQKSPKLWANIPKLKTTGSIGSIIWAILEVQVQPGRGPWSLVLEFYPSGDLWHYCTAPWLSATT